MLELQLQQVVAEEGVYDTIFKHIDEQAQVIGEALVVGSVPQPVCFNMVSDETGKQGRLVRTLKPLRIRKYPKSAGITRIVTVGSSPT